jgi:hypothetical protein
VRGSYRVRQALTGKSGLGVTSPEHVVRGPSASSLARGESPRSQNVKRVAALVTLRRSKPEVVLVRRSFTRLQKSIGDHCRPHRSSSTGPTAGSAARRTGSERGPSPRRRTLLTREKSWTEAEPRVKQASRDTKPMRGCAHRGSRIQARVGRTAAHEGGAKSRSRHGGTSA